MTALFTGTGITLPVLAAPMAGGSTTPHMVAAAAAAGGMGFLAAGYKPPAELAEQIQIVRAKTESFGVNLFAPNPIPVDRIQYDNYILRMQVEAERLGVMINRGGPLEDDDAWREKVDLLAHDPVPVVSFTFGLPDLHTVRTLKTVGTMICVTVTSAREAEVAEQIGADALIVQASAAGGHSGTFTPRVNPENLSLGDLVRSVRAVTHRPLIAAGGISTPKGVIDTLASGAVAVAVGTALLLTPESGASSTYKEALSNPAFEHTVVTRAFTGRPARALRNKFTELHSDFAPSGYPALHHLTSPIRKAAASAGDPHALHLWAGTGHRTIPIGGTSAVLSHLASIT